MFSLIRGRTIVLKLDGRSLSDLVYLGCFADLRPDMKRSEIHNLMGEPYRVHVTDIEYGENGEVEYQEICWAYPCKSGILNYYVEEYDVPGGSVEYVPDSMSLDNFFRIPLKVDFGKRFIEIRNNNRCILEVRLADKNTIKRINWYWAE